MTVLIQLERHLVTGVDGRCAACGGVEPCRARVRLEAMFAQYDLGAYLEPVLTLPARTGYC